MLIPAPAVLAALERHGIRDIRGVLHVGAHDCEELPFYREGLGLADASVVWIDALPAKVAEARGRGIPNVFEAVVGAADGQAVVFRRTNNDQSSSLLELGTHRHHHPDIEVVAEYAATTTTLDTFLAERGLDPAALDFWNLDIQGAELLALRGGSAALAHARAVYTEVNIEEVYRGCALLPDLDAWMDAHGLRRVLTHLTDAGWGDALYVRVKDTGDIQT